MDIDAHKRAFKHVFSFRSSYIALAIGTAIMGGLMLLFTDYDIIFGNLGAYHGYTHILADSVISILFGINIAYLYHKLQFAKDNSILDAKTTTLAGLVSLLVTGCPACSLTLASYLGLSAVIAALPFFGLEIKMIAIALLFYSIYDLSKNMFVCHQKKPKKG